MMRMVTVVGMKKAADTHWALWNVWHCWDALHRPISLNLMMCLLAGILVYIQGNLVKSNMCTKDIKEEFYSVWHKTLSHARYLREGPSPFSLCISKAVGRSLCSYKALDCCCIIPCSLKKDGRPKGRSLLAHLLSHLLLVGLSDPGLTPSCHMTLESCTEASSRFALEIRR